MFVWSPGAALLGNCSALAWRGSPAYSSRYAPLTGAGTCHLALPDGDEVSGRLSLQQAEVEADAMTDGHRDQPDAVLGAGVGLGVPRGVHSAVEGGDVPAAGNCGERAQHALSTQNALDFPTKSQLPAQSTLLGRRGDPTCQVPCGPAPPSTSSFPLCLPGWEQAEVRKRFGKGKFLFDLLFPGWI